MVCLSHFTTRGYLSHLVMTTGYMSHSVVTIHGLSIPFYDKGLPIPFCGDKWLHSHSVVTIHGLSIPFYDKGLPIPFSGDNGLHVPFNSDNAWFLYPIYDEKVVTILLVKILLFYCPV